MVVLTEVFPGSTSSSSTHDYDVFLSFRGADTRYGFTDHLYNALLDADINTFLDDEEIVTGEPLKPELDGAIRSSRASIIVLSKNYASSTWCLDELVLILKQQGKFNQIVIPIFYDVEPTDVRKQQSSFGEAMEKHKQRMEAETDAEKRSEWGQKMELWKRALTQVAGLKGKVTKGRKETEFIEEVVIEIQCRLSAPLSNTLPSLIGRDFHIKFISSWLTDGSCHTTDILTVVGMGGIGKTSLAKYVFQLHSTKFHKSSFIEGINTICNERSSGLLDLQKQLLGDITGKTRLQVNDVSVYTSKIENALACKRVFIVLDDIGSLHLLNALLGSKGLYPGSKIIITTKDASLTEKCALFNRQVQPKHKMLSLNRLYESASVKLFCIHAFKSPKPKEGYKEVSENLVKYCDGHPLALQVLGSSLQNEDVAYWEDCIKALKKGPHSHINTALRMSFDALPFENDKELFKHISCFFVGIDRDVTETILNACHVYTISGIKNLTDRCLLSIRGNELMMHSLIQEMGRDLVRQESPNKPWERSRLWCHEESFKVLKQKKDKGSILGLALDTRMLEKKKLSGSFELKTGSFSQMDNLMLLQLNYVQLNGCFENFPEELRWLCLQGSPLKSIPLDLPMENVVTLDMSDSNIKYFDMSKDKRLLGSLKILDLSFCEQLHSVGGFLELPALERLIVRNCIRLIEVCESVGQCVELVLIDLSYCYALKKVPISLGKLKKVKTLLLDGCSSRKSQIQTIPSDLKLIAFSLPCSLIRLSLESNNLRDESFPMDFSCLSMLRELYLNDNPLVSMPSCVRTLPRLELLSMENCRKLISIEHPPSTLRELYARSHNPFPHELLRIIKFNPEMSPLHIVRERDSLSVTSIEIDGVLKVQGMASVKEKVLHSLGWRNFEFLKEMCFQTLEEKINKEGSLKPYGSIEFETQMFYEFGIFSTLYWGEEMPDWISCRSKGPSISFIIPSSPNNLRGLNFYCNIVGMDQFYKGVLPFIKVSNTRTNHTWTYKHYCELLMALGHRLSWLSHWLFGPNEMKAGDHITITVVVRAFSRQQRVMDCGVSFVYEDEEIEEEDVLGYYKSWNHIIGGDLSAFQTTTGKYFLNNTNFTPFCPFSKAPPYHPFIDKDARRKEENGLQGKFKAFSQKKKSDEMDSKNDEHLSIGKSHEGGKKKAKPLVQISKAKANRTEEK